MEGYFNSPQAVEAVEFYRKLYEDCAPPGHSDAYMVANLDAYKSGQVAFQMNWYAFWPGVSKEDSDGRVSGFFANPKQNVAAATFCLGFAKKPLTLPSLSSLETPGQKAYQFIWNATCPDL